MAMSSRRLPPLNAITSSTTRLRTICGLRSTLDKKGEQPLLAIELGAAARFGQTVAVEEEQFPDAETGLRKAELHVLEGTCRRAGPRQARDRAVPMDHGRRGVAGIRIGETAVPHVEDGEEDRHERIRRRRLVDDLVRQGEDLCRRLAPLEGVGADGVLGQRGKHRGVEPLACDVADGDADAVRPELEEIVEVAADSCRLSSQER